MDAVAANAGGHSFGCHAIPCRRARRPEQRYGQRRSRQPEGRHHARSVEGHRVLPQRGSGVSQHDARGTTVTRDTDGNAVDRVTPLERATGAELGVRTVALRHLQSTLSVWTLKLDSELVYSGDAGTTEASRPSERQGVEWANYYSPFA